MTPFSPVCRDNILALAKEFARLKSLKLRTVSRYVRGDPYFLNDYAHGRISVTVKKYDEIMDYFEKHWPDGHPMPAIREP